jgi:Family of unknown function (DUF6011)
MMDMRTASMVEMANEVIADHAAEGCCTVEDPCMVVQVHLVNLEKVGAGYKVSQYQAKPETPGHRPNGGAKAGNQYGTFQVKYATEKQARYLNHLLESKDVSGLGSFAADLINLARPAAASGKISKRLASDALSILVDRPYRTDVKVTVRMASDKQQAFITRLMDEKETHNLANVVDVKTLTSKQASEIIETLIAAPRKAPVMVEHRSGVMVAKAEVADGIYSKDGIVYKVQYNREKTGLYAKVLVVDGPGEAHFNYFGSVRKTGLTAQDKMTLEQAKEFGALYGTCCNCGRTLTDEKSIEAGIGPICAGKFA